MAIEVWQIQEMWNTYFVSWYYQSFHSNTSIYSGVPNKLTDNVIYVL